MKVGLYRLELSIEFGDEEIANTVDVELRGMLTETGKEFMAADPKFKEFIDKLTLEAVKVVDETYGADANATHSGQFSETPAAKEYLAERGSKPKQASEEAGSANAV